MINTGEIKKVINEHDMHIAAENFAYEQLLKTSNLLKEIDYVQNGGDLKPLYNYKLGGIQEDRQQSQKIVSDYKNGVNDPSRDIAKQDKSSFLKT